MHLERRDWLLAGWRAQMESKGLLGARARPTLSRVLWCQVGPRLRDLESGGPVFELYDQMPSPELPPATDDPQNTSDPLRQIAMPIWRDCDSTHSLAKERGIPPTTVSSGGPGDSRESERQPSIDQIHSAHQA